jgi:hypothetical protein
MTRERLFAICEEELDRLRKQIDYTLAYTKKPESAEPLYKQLRFIMWMMERLVVGPEAQKTAWDRIVDD